MDSLLNILLNNLMAQTAYTPQALEQISKVPVSLRNYSTSGLASYDPNRGVELTPEVLSDPHALRILRHEMAHALDENVSRQYGLQTNKPTSSAGFYPTFEQALPTEIGNLFKWLAETGYLAKNPEVQNIEGFAQYGAGGQYSLLSPPPVSKYYENLYIPMSKNINYSPMFQAPEFFK